MRETLAEIECHIAFLHLKHVVGFIGNWVFFGGEKNPMKKPLTYISMIENWKNGDGLGYVSYYFYYKIETKNLQSAMYHFSLAFH